MAVPVADPPSVIDDGDGRQITELEDFHIEGIVSSQKTFTRAEPSEKRADFIDSDFNGHLSNYHFAVDIKDGHFTGTVKKLQPEFPPLNICNGDVVSSTDSSYLSARAGPEPGQAPVEASPVLEGDLSDFKHLAQAIADHLGEDKPKHETRSCNCFPTSLPIVSWWRPSMSSTVGEGLEKYLLGKVEENQDENNTVGMSLSTGETQVELQRGQPSVNGTGEICNCLPSLHKFPLYDVFRDHQVSADPWLPGTEVGDMTTPLLGRTPQNAGTVVEIDHSEISVAVEGATSAEAAAGASAVAQGQSRSRSEGDRAPLEYLKSVVHGGLDVTLVSLGVVASAAGGDAKTITVVALGLANLVFGLITHLSVIMSLYYNNRTQFKEEVGQGFIHGCLSFISFLFFGSLSPITYGFSFRNATSHNFKFAATCVVALVSIVLLGAARARVKSKSTVRVIYILVFTGFLASIAGYGTGNLVAQLLEQFGFFSV